MVIAKGKTLSINGFQKKGNKGFGIIALMLVNSIYDRRFNMTILYFSATGNSLAVAKRIGGELISIPQAIKANQYEYADDVIGFVFPTYCCYPPKIVRDFLRKAKLTANYLFAIATYGNAMGNGGDGAEMLEFGKLAQAAGYEFQYLNSILMVDNFIDNFDINKEIEKIPSKKIEDSIDAILADIVSRKNYTKEPGLSGKAITFVCRSLVKNQDKGLMAQSFTVNENCVSCGICSKVCPVGNINIDGGKPQFGTSCLGCYACLHNCPEIAIHKVKEKSEKRWRHPEVSLSEIIEANTMR
ncbi:MAG: EFR1 family ferrodoxin [Bacillota bacterium]|nr:EFR1 family ferrodoxin [Bacillota bacterium]